MDNLTIDRVSEFELIEHLFWYDGPLLSLFKDTRTGMHYVYSWVAENENDHTWLIFPLPDGLLSDYVNDKIQTGDVLRSVNDFYLVDIAVLNFRTTTWDLAYRNFHRPLLEELPEFILGHWSVYAE